jgi:hypothetical protein
MQYLFSILPNTLDSIEKTMSSARLDRFMAAARQDKQRALRLYFWNAELCQEFYLPIQMTEISLRNSIHRHLQASFQEDWHADRSFTAALPARSQTEIAAVVADERARRGASFTVDHIVAGMSFGFWHSLMNASLQNRVWGGNIRPMFPNLPHHMDRRHVHDRLEKLRAFRNAVMHHYAIFDKAPSLEWENIKIILGWLCQPTTKLMIQMADPKRILSAKPTI